MSLFVGNLYISILKRNLNEVFGQFGKCKIDLKVNICLSFSLSLSLLISQSLYNILTYRKNMHLSTTTNIAMLKKL